MRLFEQGDYVEVLFGTYKGAHGYIIDIQDSVGMIYCRSGSMAQNRSSLDAQLSANLPLNAPEEVS